MNIYAITYTGQDFNFINCRYHFAATSQHEALVLFAKLYLTGKFYLQKDGSAENELGKRTMAPNGESIYHIRGNFHAERKFTNMTHNNCEK